MIRLDFNKRLDTSDGSMDLRIQTEIAENSFVTVYGPSGAGKTSMLRIIAGLLKADAGSMSVNEVLWFDLANGVDLSPQKRNVGYVFQDYALFPHMTVRENLEYALPKKGDQKTVSELLELMELGNLATRKPKTLSGGQQQRVALARALVQKPKILLLDEPLAALDYKFRLKLQDYLLEIHREFGLTTFLVSHDISEISKLSDMVLVLDNGRIEEQGTPEEIFIKQQISGKFKFVGEVLQIELQEVVAIVTVLIQTQVVKVIAQPREMQGISVGDKVVIASKAFNPIIYKID